MATEFCFPFPDMHRFSHPNFFEFRNPCFTLCVQVSFHLLLILHHFCSQFIHDRVQIALRKDGQFCSNKEDIPVVAWGVALYICKNSTINDVHGALSLQSEWHSSVPYSNAQCSISFRMIYGGVNVLDISFLQEMFELG